MQRRSNRRRDRLRAAAQKMTADKRAKRAARHPLDRAREAARAAYDSITGMVASIEAAGKANEWDRRGLGFMAAATHGSLGDARSLAKRAEGALRVLASDLEDLGTVHGDEIRGILGRLHMESNWELIFDTMGVEWLQDARVGVKIDRMRIKAKAARVHLGKLCRSLDAIAEALGRTE